VHFLRARGPLRIFCEPPLPLRVFPSYLTLRFQSQLRSAEYFLVAIVSSIVFLGSFFSSHSVLFLQVDPAGAVSRHIQIFFLLPPSISGLSLTPPPLNLRRALRRRSDPFLLCQLLLRRRPASFWPPSFYTHFSRCRQGIFACARLLDFFSALLSVSSTGRQMGLANPLFFSCFIFRRQGFFPNLFRLPSPLPMFFSCA